MKKKGTRCSFDRVLNSVPTFYDFQIYTNVKKNLRPSLSRHLKPNLKLSSDYSYKILSFLTSLDVFSFSFTKKKTLFWAQTTRFLPKFYKYPRSHPFLSYSVLYPSLRAKRSFPFPHPAFSLFSRSPPLQVSKAEPLSGSSRSWLTQPPIRPYMSPTPIGASG
jgi:hypothetical protein